MIHLRPIPEAAKKRCDTRALLDARQRVKRELQNNKAEKELDARMPRHFAERQAYIRNGGS